MTQLRALEGWIILLAIAAPAVSQRNVPKELLLKGNPAGKLVLAQGWEPRPVEWTDSTKPRMKAAPFWCSRCQSDRRYAPRAAHPERPRLLLKQNPAHVIGWGRKDYKLDPVVLASEHAVLVVSLKPMKKRDATREEQSWLKQHFPGLKAKLDGHQRAHLYGLRYLRLEAQWRDLVCQDPAAEGFQGPLLEDHLGSQGRAEVYVFPDLESYRAFGRHFFGAHGKWTSWWWHKETETIIGAMHASDVTEPELASRFDAVVAHNLVYQYRGFYHRIPVWIPVGVGHFFARRHKKRSTTYFLLGHPGMRDKNIWAWDEPNWWKVNKDLASRDKNTPVVRLGAKTKLYHLPPIEQSQSWSLITYMVGLGKDRWRLFLDEVKVRRGDEGALEIQARAFERAYGVNPAVFERAWKRWVRTVRPKG